MTFEELFQKAVNEKVREYKNLIIDEVIMMLESSMSKEDAIERLKLSKDRNLWQS